MTITHLERDCLEKYRKPLPHLKESHGKTLTNLLKRGWIAKVDAYKDTVYPIYQTTSLGLEKLGLRMRWTERHCASEAQLNKKRRAFTRRLVSMDARVKPSMTI